VNKSNEPEHLQGTIQGFSIVDSFDQQNLHCPCSGFENQDYYISSFFQFLLIEFFITLSHYSHWKSLILNLTLPSLMTSTSWFCSPKARLVNNNETLTYFLLDSSKTLWQAIICQRYLPPINRMFMSDADCSQLW